MKRRGAGDYLLCAPSYKLLDVAAVPALKDLFEIKFNLGRTVGGAQGRFELSARGEQVLWGARQDRPTRIIFGHGDAAESLEAATYKGAVCDEAGQKRFKPESWEAVQRRLSIDKGRCLFPTTPYCYDESVEVYTRRGWQTFGELTADDEVLACQPTGEAHFEKPARIVWERYSGPMIALKGGRVDLLVTPNHRILFRDHEYYYTKTAAEYVRRKYRSMAIPKTVRVQGPFPDTFTLPPVSIGHRWGPKLCKPLGILMRDWCAFLGWFLSEGCVHGCEGGKIKRQCYKVTICQRPGPKRRKMRADLAKLPFKWNEHKGGFTTQSKQLWSHLSEFGGSGTKYIPDEVKRADPAHLRVLIDRMVLGDGTYRHDRKGEFVYYTTSPRLAADFREVCMLAGISTNLSERANVSGGEIKGRKITATRTIFHVSERKRQGAIVQSHETVQYSGHIGCVTVSTGYVLVRRNGEEVICGNSIGWLKEQIHDRAVRRAEAIRRGEPANIADRDYEVVNFESIENPAFPLEEWERARSTLAAWKFDLFYRGKFSRPAGSIYDCFDPSYHVVNPADLKGWVNGVPPLYWPRTRGIDFGSPNFAAVYLCEEMDDLGPDPHTGETRYQRTGRYVAYREYLPGEPRTAADHEQAMRTGEPVAPELVVGGSWSEGQWRKEFLAAGLLVQEPDQPEVEVGIDRVYAAFKTGNLFISNRCPNLIRQIVSYSRVVDDFGQAENDIDEKEKFHLPDALRYIISVLRRPGSGFDLAP